MNRIKRIMMTVVLSLGLLFAPSKCARADLFGVTDAALLAQQFAQFMQDWDMLGKAATSVVKIKDKLAELERIIDLVSDGSKAFQTINDIVKSSRQIIRTGQKIERYIEYLSRFGDNFRIDRAYYILNSFIRRTEGMYNEVQKTIRSFGGNKTVEPIDLFKIVDDMTKQLADSISDAGEEAEEEIVQLCYEMTIDSMVQENQDFMNARIY